MSKSKSKSKRRFIIIGPGILLALIFALQVAIQNHQKAAAPPIIERQVLASSSSHAVLSPEIGFILKHKNELRLTDGQQAKLTKLQAEWDAKSGPMTAEMNKAAADFQSFMRKAGGKAMMRDIQSHAGPVSELSRQVSSLRTIYWQKAQQILSAEQRKAVEGLSTTRKEASPR